MAEMSPVELLRAAAAKVRERADNASVGPWRVLADPQDDAAPLTAVGVWSSEEAFVFECHDTMRVDAEWIALVHPLIASPLADMFEKVARVVRLDPDFVHRVGYSEAVAVARVLLGVPDGR